LQSLTVIILPRGTSSAGRLEPSVVANAVGGLCRRYRSRSGWVVSPQVAALEARNVPYASANVGSTIQAPYSGSRTMSSCVRAYGCLQGTLHTYNHPSPVGDPFELFRIGSVDTGILHVKARDKTIDRRRTISTLFWPTKQPAAPQSQVRRENNSTAPSCKCERALCSGS